jgi:signal transduction histidine kinase
VAVLPTELTEDGGPALQPRGQTRPLCPVAGIGASAGGLAAAADLLRHLGPNPGVAVVMVHDLASSHDSTLAELFSKVTAMPVVPASDGTLVEPNHVYVATPSAGLGIVNGTLHLTPRDELGGLDLPIDRFFESLAVDRTVHALGAVLSGTGSDGTRGIRAIKSSGGITFAQDASAEYGSMPESAIATRCVDFVSSPGGIAKELVRIGEHWPTVTSASSAPATDVVTVPSVDHGTAEHRLTQELAATRNDLRSVIERLEATNEELKMRNVEVTRLNDAEGIVDKEVRAYQDRLQQMAFDTALTEDRERRRIATQVHDHIGQSLALAQIKLTSMRETIRDPGRATFDEAVELLEQSIVDTRTLIFDLSPPVLYDLGLREALSWLVEEFEKRHGILIGVTDDGMDKRLDDATAGLVFRAVRELLTNVFKHAKADSARVSLRRAGDHIDIEVEDKGTGFDAKALGSQSSGGGFGLFSVREQISRLGGTVEIISAPGQGTRVNMRVPLNTDESPTRVDVAAH